MGPRRRVTEPEGITIARLDGAARRLVRDQVDVAAAVAEVRKISTDPRVVGTAAGRALGSWRRDPIIGHDGDRAAVLLVEAGGDADVMESVADETQRRLSLGGNGIGNPG